MNLDVQNWKEFRLDDLFIIVRGDRIVKDEDYFDAKDSQNIYPVITTTVSNNGIDGYYSRYNCEGNCIISAGEASGMYTTYQPKKCWALDTVRVYHPKGFDMNIHRGMFLASVLTTNMYRYSYGRKAKPSNMYPLLIKLPATPDGTPDWDFMERYIKSLNHKPLTTKNMGGCSLHTLGTDKWKEFRVGDLFDIHPTKFIDGVSADDCVGVGCPLVVNSAENNGVAGLCDLEPTESGNIITFSDTTDGNTFFYQPSPFIGFAHVQGMYPKNQIINRNIMLFISAMLMFDSKGRYSYGRKMRRDTISEIMLRLPADADGNPDWQFMENYIKALPYGDRI